MLELFCTEKKPGAEFVKWLKIQQMRLCHPPDGSTSPKYKLLCFIISKKIGKEKNALAFNRDRCRHLVLCLRLIPSLLLKVSLVDTFYNICYYKKVILPEYDIFLLANILLGMDMLCGCANALLTSRVGYGCWQVKLYLA